MENVIQRYLEKHGFGQFCPKAVLFDMDGVIYDSMPNHSVSWHDAMASYGLDMPYDGAYKYEGMRGVETIKPYVDEFIGFARQHPELRFLVTRIGCGIAGFEPEEIAPLFAEAIDLENVILPEDFVY